MSGLGDLPGLESQLKDYLAALEGQETQSLSDLIVAAGKWGARAEQLSNRIELLNEGGIDLEGCPSLERLPDRAEKLKERVASDWRRYKHGGHHKAINSELLPALRNQEAWLLAQWIAFCVAQAGEDRAPTVLDKVPRFCAVVEQIREYQRAIEEAKAGFPHRAEDIKCVRDAGEHIIRLAASLDWTVLGERVQNFLINCTQGDGVTADVFRDPELVKDLDRHGMLEDFVVRPKTALP